MARDAVLSRVLVGLKERLRAPALMEEFARAYVAEINAANRERGNRQAGLRGQVAKFDRQIRPLLDLIKDGHGGVAMAGELREVERRRETLLAEIVTAGVMSVLPRTCPPSIAGVSRRWPIPRRSGRRPRLCTR